MLDSDLSEPATARGGRIAPPNRFLNPYLWIGAVVCPYVKQLYTKERYLRASLSRPAGEHMTPEYRPDTGMQIMLFITAEKRFRKLYGWVYSED